MSKRRVCLLFPSCSKLCWILQRKGKSTYSASLEENCPTSFQSKEYLPKKWRVTVPGTTQSPSFLSSFSCLHLPNSSWAKDSLNARILCTQLSGGVLYLMSRMSIGKPWPEGQIQLIICFWKYSFIGTQHMLTHLRNVYGCFQISVAATGTVRNTKPKILLSGPLQKLKSLPIPGLEGHSPHSTQQRLLIIWGLQTVLHSLPLNKKKVCKTMFSTYYVHFPREKVLAFNRFPKESRVPPTKAKENQRVPLAASTFNSAKTHTHTHTAYTQTRRTYLLE